MMEEVFFINHSRTRVDICADVMKWPFYRDQVAIVSMLSNVDYGASFPMGSDHT